jgi:phosphoglycolate phosphatase-like HAD superfamily hydrolase
MKLEAAGLRDFFSFGAFSDDCETREDIFRSGAAEVKRRLRHDARLCIVGDTPADIEAAKALGLPVIAVATGIYSREQLQAYKPDVCVDSCQAIMNSKV